TTDPVFGEVPCGKGLTVVIWKAYVRWRGANGTVLDTENEMMKRINRAVWAAGAVLMAAGAASGQLSSIFVNCAGLSVPSSGVTPDVVATSTQLIQAAPGYQFEFNPMVHGAGLTGLIAIGLTPKPLEDVLDSF